MIGKKLKKNHVITTNPAGIYLLKVNNTNTKTRCEICSKLTIKTPIDANTVALLSLLFTLNMFHIMFWCFCCQLRTCKCRLGSVRLMINQHNFFNMSCIRFLWDKKLRKFCNSHPVDKLQPLILILINGKNKIFFAIVSFLLWRMCKQ